MNTLTKKTGLTTFTLVMLIVGAIDSIRNLPATALFGSSLIFFFILSAIVFLIPAALVSSELSSTHTEKSGIYYWTTLAFGEKAGFLAIWLQWINTMVWFPTILSFLAGTMAYLIDPSIAQNKLYLVTVILATFWLLTYINLKGIHVSAKFSNFCALTGTVIPMVLMIVLAVLWICLGKPLQIHLTAATLIPQFNQTENWISLTAIMSAFLGMELATVHIKDVANPQKTFPKALYISVVFILLTMVLGSLAIAFVLPQSQINLVNGVMQSFTSFFAAYHMSWIMPVIALSLIVGNFGGIISWIISPAKGLLQAAQLGYLPEFLKKENKHGIAQNLLITQALLVSFVCLAFLLMPSVNGSYWLLTDLSTQLYMIMYVFMFCAAIAIKNKSDVNATANAQSMMHAAANAHSIMHTTANGHSMTQATSQKQTPVQSQAFKIPGGKLGMALTCVLGLLGCAITLVVGFFPPDGVNVGTTFHYEMIFSAGIIAMILPVLFFYGYKSFKDKAINQANSSAKQETMMESL